MRESNALNAAGSPLNFAKLTSGSSLVLSGATCMHACLLVLKPAVGTLIGATLFCRCPFVCVCEREQCSQCSWKPSQYSCKFKSGSSLVLSGATCMHTCLLVLKPALGTLIGATLFCRCPFVLKPASRTPIGALIIAEILAVAPHLPKGAFSVLPCSREGADLFTTDPRFKLLTFTGSPSVVRPPTGKCDLQHPALSGPQNLCCGAVWPQL